MVKAPHTIHSLVILILSWRKGLSGFKTLETRFGWLPMILLGCVYATINTFNAILELHKTYQGWRINAYCPFLLALNLCKSSNFTDVCEEGWDWIWKSLHEFQRQLFLKIVVYWFFYHQDVWLDWRRPRCVDVCLFWQCHAWHGWCILLEMLQGYIGIDFTRV